jgi:hypothetical protein
MRLSLYSLLLILFFTSIKTNAQKVTIYGHLKDSITQYPIEGAIITNVTSKQKISTDQNGLFRIQAAPNDFFYILARAYRPDTFTFSSMFQDTVTIFLSPTGNLLPGVTVTTNYTRYQLDSVKRRKDFEENMGHPLSTIASSHGEGFGLTVNLDRFFKKKYKNRKQDERMFETLEKTAYADYRFSPYIVAHYTGFKGDVLKDFMSRYTPDYNWLRQHPLNEDVLYYINDKLKVYKASVNK